MRSGVSKATLVTLVQRALAGDGRYHQRRFGDEVLAYVGRMCRARAPDLASDLVRDVAQETMVGLFAAAPEVVGAASPLKLLRHAALAAIRRVRADHAPPGRRARRRRCEEGDRVAPDDVSRMPNAAAMRYATVIEGEHAALDVDRFACPAADEASLDAERRIDIDIALAQLPPDIAQAFRIVHRRDRSLAEAAEDVGISRFVLRRRIAQHRAAFGRAA